MDFSDCSLILLNYSRPECMERILKENVALPWKQIVLVDAFKHALEYGTPDQYVMEIPQDSRLLVLETGEPFGVYGRSQAAILADSDYVCTQDDDVFVRPEGWRRLFQEWDNASIVFLQPEWREPELKLGHGSLFNRRWMQASWAHCVGSEAFPEQKEHADVLWTTFWGLSKRIEGWQKHMTFLLNRHWMRAETDEHAMSQNQACQQRRELVKRWAEEVRDAFCSSPCQTEPSCHTELLKLVEACFG